MLLYPRFIRNIVGEQPECKIEQYCVLESPRLSVVDLMFDISSASGFYKFLSFVKFGKFSNIPSKSTFSNTFFSLMLFLSFGDSDHKNIRVFL